jgi:hypothetical protein
MEVKNTCRIEKADDDAINRIVVKEKLSKNKALIKIIKLGLNAYFNEKPVPKKENSEDKFLSEIDDLQQKIQDLSLQITDVDLKSYRMNLFITDFAKLFFEGTDKFDSLNQELLVKMERYKTQIKYTPKLGFVVLKHIKDILNRNIPDEFYSEIENISMAMINKKTD